ncbi:myb-like HTH transcriptional regulator family protein [Actinidia rufa]|uniref:Myb-like HTH transcriptional regulator family protein n=1 Tax=Actinidia rufa TaxID=165716 RepID=A0A7J0FR83_9ERIC|nr:myb-like HTH transcriptional regulator family protein [Actinidia rufa]
MRKRAVMGDDQIRKGPWKAEEDEVLIKHVKKYGPRDWSSIRSKGLLHRTGKSCRLRWVNKLRPNLKNGVKFSAEEERIVIELQGQFGNKWARIATYLPGRTDNDVKNFWSSRQKRLARLLQTPTPRIASSKSHNSKQVSILHDDGPTDIVAPKISSLKSSCSFISPNFLHHDQNLLHLDFDSAKENQILLFPSIPQVLQQPEFPRVLENEVSTNFLDTFANFDAADLGSMAQIPLVPPCFGPPRGQCCQTESPVTSGGFFNDFPVDMFDPMDPISSPSEW